VNVGRTLANNLVLRINNNPCSGLTAAVGSLSYFLGSQMASSIHISCVSSGWNTYGINSTSAGKCWCPSDFMVEFFLQWHPRLLLLH
jgi:hypothetical protein